MRCAPLLGPLLTVLACSTLVPPEVLVHIDADTISRKRARQLHVRIVSQEGATRLDRTASLFGKPPEVELPTTVPVVPMGNDSARTFTLFAELSDQENVAFNKKAATLSFVDDQLKEVELYFSDLCIGIDCPEGQTCADGSCVDITTPPHGPGGPQASDAQPAVCDGILCWEEPRPSGSAIKAACLWAADAGMALNDDWALLLSGGLWIPEPLPKPAGVDSVACWSGGEAIATSGTGILERSASGWKPLALGTTALHGVWGPSADDVWVVADGGVIWRRKSHGAWAQVSSGVSTNLIGIFGLAPDDVYVVGAQSTLLHYDGASFTPVPGPAAADPAFSRVAGSSKSDLAVKAGTSVWTFDGAAWSEYAPYLGVVSLAGGPSGLLVAGGSRGAAHLRSKPGAPWALAPVDYPFDGPALQATAVLGDQAILGGDLGSLARWSGSTWDSKSAWLHQLYPHGIAADPDDPAHVVVVGGGGSVQERVGEGLWRRRLVAQGTEVKTPDLHAVWMGHKTFIAVGAGGAIAESANGHDWGLTPSGTTLDLAAVDIAGDKVIAGGASGVLLERGASGWSPFATPLPTLPSVTALRGAADGSLFAGADDGSIWKLTPGAGWTKLGTLPTAVTDLALDSGGGLWACAGAVYQLQGGVFTELAIGTSWIPHKLLIEGKSPGWIATDGYVYQQNADGAYAQVGPSAEAIALAADGRFFMAGYLGRILAQRAP
jgi:hypothetical protein